MLLHVTVSKQYSFKPFIYFREADILFTTIEIKRFQILFQQLIDLITQEKQIKIYIYIITSHSLITFRRLFPKYYSRSSSIHQTNNLTIFDALRVGIIAEFEKTRPIRIIDWRV